MTLSEKNRKRGADLTCDDRMKPGAPAIGKEDIGCCWFCMSCYLPRVRGIPDSAKLLSMEEQQLLLAPLQVRRPLYVMSRGPPAWRPAARPPPPTPAKRAAARC